MKIPDSAVVASLLRYALSTPGSCPAPNLVNEIDTQIINVSARKPMSAPRTMRKESTRHIAGAHSVNNLYIAHCAHLVGANLRAGAALALNCAQLRNA